LGKPHFFLFLRKSGSRARPTIAAGPQMLFFLLLVVLVDDELLEVEDVDVVM